MKNVILLLFILIGICSLSSCGKRNKEANNDDTLEKYCASYASEYEIVDTKDDGSVQASIVAPDFRTIIEYIIDEKKVNDISVNDIQEVIESNPDYIKEYVFWVDSEDNDKIKREFLEEVSRDLVVQAIEKIEITEEWSTEE